MSCHCHLTPILAPRGKKLSKFIKFKRFFITPNKTHPPVSPMFKNMMKKVFPKVKWEQHHVGIQQKWFRQGGPNQWYPNDYYANLGMQRLGNAGFNLMAIPRGLNAALGRSGLGTAGFAVGSYGMVAWAVYEIISAIGGEE